MNPDRLLDALLALPGLKGPQVSPDGRWVAWSWARVGPTVDVYAAPTDGSSGPLRLTANPEDTWLLGWSPDSAAVLVEHDHDGDEHMQLLRVDLDRPGVLQPLTEPSPGYFLSGGDLHPNRRWLVYAANVDAATGAVIEASWVYRHDLTTGERRALARPQQAGFSSPQLSRPGTHVLYTRRDLHPAGEQLWVVDIEGREDRELLSAGDSAKVVGSWLPDGRGVLVLAEAGAHRRLGLCGLDGCVRWLIDDPERNLEYAYAPPDSGGLAVVVEVRGARPRVSLLDLGSGEEIALPALPGALLPLRRLADGAWVGVRYSATEPGDIVRFRLDDLRPEAALSLTRAWERTALRPADLAPAEDFRWRADDGLEIQGWLYRARGPARGTVVYVHGGPTFHSEDRFDPQVQFFVAQGFHVLTPNYRGSTGFGLAFQEAIKQDGWGGREQDDIRAGIEALIAAGIAKPGRVGITGTSYGGYSSWCAITRLPPELLAAAAPICGMTDLVVDYHTTRPDLRPYSEEMLGGRPDELPERYRERSPIHFVGNIRGQLLIIQGLRDPNVTPDNVRVVTAALQDVGVEYQLLAFEDEGHGIIRPDNQRALFRQLASFFAGAFEARG